MNTNFSLKDLFLNRPNNPWIQFIKYGVCGALSTVITIIVLVTLNVLYPAFVDPEHLSSEALSRNTNVFNTIAFIPSVLVAYFTNRLFVFTPGRHSVGKEFAIFSLISSISFIGGLIGSDWVVKSFESTLQIGNIVLTSSHFGSLAFGVSSALINFVCRKFIIFKG